MALMMFGSVNVCIVLNDVDKRLYHNSLTMFPAPLLNLEHVTYWQWSQVYLYKTFRFKKTRQRCRELAKDKDLLSFHFFNLVSHSISCLSINLDCKLTTAVKHTELNFLFFYFCYYGVDTVAQETLSELFSTVFRCSKSVNNIEIIQFQYFIK